MAVKLATDCMHPRLTPNGSTAIFPTMTPHRAPFHASSINFSTLPSRLAYILPPIPRSIAWKF